MKVAVTYPDPERAAVDALEELLADEDCTVGAAVPHDWTPDDLPHVQPQWDGTPGGSKQLLVTPTIRVVVRAATPTEAKRLAILAEGLLLAHADDSIHGARSLIGVQPARDAATRTELAAFTVRLSLRTTPIT